MKVLIIGNNRSGTTLVSKIIIKILNYPSFSPYILLNNNIKFLKRNSSIGYPSLHSASISNYEVEESTGSKSFTSFYTDNYEIKNLPKDCVFRCNQIMPNSFNKLSQFDYIINVQRSSDSILISNVLDLPPAFEKLSLINKQVNRERISLDILKDSSWIKSLESQLKKDSNYINQIMPIIPNSFIVNFENLN